MGEEKTSSETPLGELEGTKGEEERKPWHLLGEVGLGC